MKNKKRITIHTINRSTRDGEINGTIGNTPFVKRNHIGGDDKRDAERVWFVKTCQDSSHPERPLSMQHLHKRKLGVTKSTGDDTDNIVRVIIDQTKKMRMIVHDCTSTT